MSRSTRNLLFSIMPMLLVACGDVTGPVGVNIHCIVVVDSYSGETPYEIEVGNGNMQVYCAPDGSYAYIPCAGLGPDITVLDCVLFEVASTISIDDDVMDLCLDDTGSELYYMNAWAVITVSVPSGAVGDSIWVPGGGMNTGIVHRPGTDLVYVSTIFPDTLVVIDTSPLSVDTGFAVSVDRLAFSPDGDVLYFSNETELGALDPDDGSLLGTVDTGEIISGICVVPGSDYIYVSWSSIENDNGGILEVDAATLATAQSLALGYPAKALCYAPAVGKLYAGIEKGTNCAVAVVDLPVLGQSGEIDFTTPGMQGLCAVPSGGYVLCSISYNNQIDF